MIIFNNSASGALDLNYTHSEFLRLEFLLGQGRTEKLESGGRDWGRNIKQNTTFFVKS